MAFDQQLADRVRMQLVDCEGLTEMKMFGGLAFLINGNMSVGIHKTELIVRIAPEGTDEALVRPGVRIFDITGRPMKGWLMVSGAGIEDSDTLAEWVHRGVAYASTLPAK